MVKHSISTALIRERQPLTGLYWPGRKCMMVVKSLTAKETLQIEMEKIKYAELDCIAPEGYVRSECRQRYQILVRQALALKQAIDYLTSIGL